MCSFWIITKKDSMYFWKDVSISKRYLWNYRSSRPEVFCKKDVLRNFTKFTRKPLFQSLFFNKVAGLRSQACNFIKKETLAQMCTCKFCEISKNTFLQRTPLMATSETSETFGITNVQIQLIPFYHRRKKEIIFRIIMFYLEMR